MIMIVEWPRASITNMPSYTKFFSWHMCCFHGSPENRPIDHLGQQNPRSGSALRADACRTQEPGAIQIQIKQCESAQDSEFHLSLVKPFPPCNVVHDLVLLQFFLYANYEVAVDPCCKDLLSNEPSKPWDKVLVLILTCLQDQLQIERLLCQKLSEFSHASCSRPGWSFFSKLNTCCLGHERCRCGNNSVDKATAHYPG